MTEPEDADRNKHKHEDFSSSIDLSSAAFRTLSEELRLDLKDLVQTHSSFATRFIKNASKMVGDFATKFDHEGDFKILRELLSLAVEVPFPQVQFEALNSISTRVVDKIKKLGGLSLDQHSEISQNVNNLVFDCLTSEVPKLQLGALREFVELDNCFRLDDLRLPEALQVLVRSPNPEIAVAAKALLLRSKKTV